MIRSLILATTAMLVLVGSAAAQTQTRARDAGGSLSEAPIQGQHVRTMIVSCKPDETVKFYRDVLGMKVLSDDGGKPVQVGQLIVDMPSTGLLRMVVFGGTGEYPAGPVIGSRIGMLGLMDPASPACKDTAKGNHRTSHGGIIMPIRVSNMPEILKRAKAMGIEVIKEGPSPSRLTWQTLLYDPNGIVLELFELNVTPIP
ncbi:MAG: VOC family protein [Rhodospirillaceae bacterium]|nr:VOC family protein [Rhodospirillaceae bacterium]